MSASMEDDDASSLSAALRSRLSNVLVNAHHYYDQYRPILKAEIETELRHVRSDLQNFIKIHRWDSATYYQLKDTTKKSHKVVACQCIAVQWGTGNHALESENGKEDPPTPARGLVPPPPPPPFCWVHPPPPPPRPSSSSKSSENWNVTNAGQFLLRRLQCH